MNQSGIQKEEGISMKRKFTITSIFLLFLLIVSSYTIFFRSQQPLVQAEKEARMIAQEVAGIENVKNFYWYNGSEETYFTVEGLNESLNHFYVVIKQSDGNTLLLDADVVVTEEEAKSILQAEKKPFEILEARIGIEENDPFWEVSYKNEDGSIGYFLISIYTGETIREYENI